MSGCVCNKERTRRGACTRMDHPCRYRKASGSLEREARAKTASSAIMLMLSFRSHFQFLDRLGMENRVHFSYASCAVMDPRVTILPTRTSVMGSSAGRDGCGSCATHPQRDSQQPMAAMNNISEQNGQTRSSQ